MRAKTENEQPLPGPLLERLSRRVVAHSGMVPPGWVLSARVRTRVTALGLASAHQYLELLSAPRGADELDRLIELLRVGETSFFRHDGHIRALTETVIPDLRAHRPAGPVRAWSAGCASGEEAYTLALVLGEMLPAPRYQVQVLGTDVSAVAIDLARAGAYPARAIQRVPEQWRARAFFASGAAAGESPASTVSQRYQIAPALARLVTFERKNLLAGGFPSDLDIIWCRNVFIYFSPGARARVVHQLVRALRPGGVLFVGYSENLRDIPEVEPVRTPHGVIYRRRGGRPPITSQAAVVKPVRVTPSSATATERRDPEADVTLALTGRYDGSGRLSSELSAALLGEPRRLVVLLHDVEYLDERAAPLLRRARSAARATGVHFEVRCTRPELIRVLRRHGLEVTSAPTASGRVGTRDGNGGDSR